MFFNEFKDFISRGNVIDLAVAVVVGAAFTGIVRSLVNDIVTPLLGIFLGGVNFSNLSLTIGHASIAYGAFIQAVINFLLISFVIFILVKAINKFERSVLHKEESKVLFQSSEVRLLTEIRDLLKNKSI